MPCLPLERPQNTDRQLASIAFHALAALRALASGSSGPVGLTTFLRGVSKSRTKFEVVPNLAYLSSALGTVVSSFVPTRRAATVRPWIMASSIDEYSHRPKRPVEHMLWRSRYWWIVFVASAWHASKVTYAQGISSSHSAAMSRSSRSQPMARSEEHTSELQSREKLVCRLLLD